MRYDVCMTKKKKFKVGDIVKHVVETYKDRFEHIDGERRFIGRDIERKEETLLIVAYEDRRFVVCPLGEVVKFPRRVYYTYGGFPNCFGILANYVQDSCTSVSS